MPRVARSSRKPDTRVSGYTAAEQIEIAVAEKAEREERLAASDRHQLGFEYGDAEGEAY